MQAVNETNFSFPGQTGFYRGKVRDVYFFTNKMIAIASDRISAFDHILPRAIPHKGQVLNQIAGIFLKQAEQIGIPIWLEETPDPQVAAGKRCETLKVEMVIRGYLAGHAWREYKSGKRFICGVSMPDGMRESDPFPEPIITPATKAEEGHDEDISKEELIRRGIVTEKQWAVLSDYTRRLFNMGSDHARRQGLILVDTKYEFGIYNGEILLIDEIHTPDSSRYYYLDGYDQRQSRGERQMQLSKEFVREWLMENGFQGLEGQVMPEMPDAFVGEVSDRYIQLFEKLTGNHFQRPENEDPVIRIEENIRSYLLAKK